MFISQHNIRLTMLLLYCNDEEHLLIRVSFWSSHFCILRHQRVQFPCQLFIFVIHYTLLLFCICCFRSFSTISSTTMNDTHFIQNKRKLLQNEGGGVSRTRFELMTFGIGNQCATTAPTGQCAPVSYGNLYSSQIPICKYLSKSRTAHSHKKQLYSSNSDSIINPKEDRHNNLQTYKQKQYKYHNQTI